MQRLGKNDNGYDGETIDVRKVLRDVQRIAQRQGWDAETFGRQGEFDLLALHRSAVINNSASRIYISAGIHGDEPAGPVAVLRLLEENRWPAEAEVFLLPCLNPMGFVFNRRENPEEIDLNRQYLHHAAAETRAHIEWLKQRPRFDLCLCLHEDWEAHGFYVYELNPENRPSLAEAIVAGVSTICPIDNSSVIEGREASRGIIRPSADPRSRPEWPEAFYLLTYQTRLSYTLEAPSDFPLATRVEALVAGVDSALKKLCEAGIN